MALSIFSDCSSSTTARLLPLNRAGSGFLHLRRSSATLLHLSPRNPNLLGVISTQSCRSSYSSTVAMTTETSAKVIDGKSVAKQIRDEITSEISRMREAIGVVPGLAVILVGDRKDSATYVRNKKKVCEPVEITSYEVCLSEDFTEQ